MVQEIISRNGFVFQKETPLPELNGRLIEMVHEKSGAQLVWLDRPDENMTFAIGFRTIPEDSTGIFHILEHSVLGGSEKYPVKEPFLELLKSSLQTFLNAMTFPDKTVYPVSSRNRRDFRNLMEIYMDAVFHPLAVRDPRIFRQEGWRLEFNEQQEPIFQGVVYNEMKGAFSSVDRAVESAMSSHLFPDTCYRHESGGDPACIPSLTYEQFQAGHARYYHPSNARIALDGSIDLEECLRFLNSCLQPYDRIDPAVSIPMQKPLPFSQAEIPYEIGAGEDPTGKTIVSCGKLLCDYRDTVQLYAADMLSDYLDGSSESPLYRAVLDTGLCEDFSVTLHEDGQQAWFGWEARNTEADRIPQIREVIRRTAAEIAGKGLDRDRLLGCYNSLAYHLMDRDNGGYPRGLNEVLNIMDPWFYGGDPTQNCAFREILAELRRRMDNGYFEDLLRRCLLDDSTGFLGIFVPSAELGEKRVQAERRRALDYWNGLDSRQKEALHAELDDLHTWQQTPDTAEKLASIPVLKLSDVDPQLTHPVWHKEDIASVPVLVHSVDTELNYISLYFDADDLLPEDMAPLNMLADMLGTFATARHSADGLQIAISQKVGTMAAIIDTYQLSQEKHRALFALHSSCLPEYRKDTAELMTELLTETLFNDRDALREHLKQEKINGERKIVSAGNRYALSRVQSRETSVGAARELMAGFENVRWIDRLSGGSDEELDALLDRMRALAEKLFVRQRLTISLTDNAADAAEYLAGACPDGAACSTEYASFPIGEVCREAIRIPAAVGFAAEGMCLDRIGEVPDGSVCALSNFLTYEYLWNAIRVQGGAYGTGFRIDAYGNILASSFRDPTPAKSVAAFGQCGAFVRDTMAESPDLTRYILGAVSDMNPLMGAASKKRTAESRYFRKSGPEEADRQYRELLNARPADLLETAAWLDSMAQRENTCIVAGPELLEACSDAYDVLLDVPGAEQQR